jgi:hypothetical protein
MKTQVQTILNLLSDGEYHCITEMIQKFIPDYRRRLCDIAEQGIELESKKCEFHVHRSGNMKMWKLAKPVRWKVLSLPDGTVVSREAIYG